jgi:acyl carrier protein
VGLDLLDITFRIEKEFDVDVSRDDLDAVVHDRDIIVGDLYELILKKLHLRDLARYDIRLNYALWTELRDLIHSVTEVPLDQIELKTPLETLFPRKNRRASWAALREASPYRIRTLGYPKAVRVAGFLLAVVMALFDQFQIWQVAGVKWLWPLLGLLGVWMLVETYAKVLSILAPLRNCFPSGMTTVKDLCRTVLATNYADFCRHVEIPLDDRSVVVWEQLTAILVEALGVDADEVTFRSRLVKDLAMG